MPFKSRPLPVPTPVARNGADQRRELARRELTLALVAQNETQETSGGFNPYDSDQGRARRDVWDARKR